MKPLLIYCYDAWCGWCYGFSPLLKRVIAGYPERFELEILSGGLILGDPPRPVAVMADYVIRAYPEVEKLTGARFGEDYLWHFRHPGISDWFPDSTKPAISLCIFKEFYPGRQLEWAWDLQYALHAEGRDLTDDEAYRHLLPKYDIEPADFYDKLQNENYLDQAKYEFALCRQLQVTGFPGLLLQVSESRFYLLARGYTDESSLRTALEDSLSGSNRKL